MKQIFKNKFGTFRSGWIILLFMVLVYLISGVMVDGLVGILRLILVQSGDINDATGAFSPLANWMNDSFLPLISQLMFDMTMIVLALLMWKFMRQKREDIGIRSFRSRFPKDGLAGMMIGIVNCSAIFIVLLLTGSAHIVSVKLQPSWMWWGWIVGFVFIGVGEELMNRGFIMSTLRRTNNMYLIMFVPSVIFGMIHLANPGVTFLSVLNIILVGIVFSWMYYKSGNLWMCIGYHITWNIFQSIIYGMPVSGLTGMDSIMTTQFPVDNLLNGGSFGMEGGILTTVVTVALFIFTNYYYRNSDYQFLPEKASGITEIREENQ